MLSMCCWCLPACQHAKRNSATPPRHRALGPVLSGCDRHNLPNKGACRSTVGRRTFLKVPTLQVDQTQMTGKTTNGSFNRYLVTLTFLKPTVCVFRQYMQPVPAAKKRSFLPALLLLTDLAWIATYLVSMGLNGWAFENLKLNPMAGGSAKTLTTLGAVDYDKVVNAHQWWRIVAAPFLCSGEPLSSTVIVASGPCCRAAADAAYFFNKPCGFRGNVLFYDSFVIEKRLSPFSHVHCFFSKFKINYQWICSYAPSMSWSYNVMTVCCT